MSSAANPSVDKFLSLVKQSGLISDDQLKQQLAGWQQTGVAVQDARQVAEELVRVGLLTRWQADKLLQGRHRGFFLGKYRLLSLLGSGGMSAVYLAEHILMRRRVAIKVLPSKRVDDSSYLQRFHREAQAVAALDHRNIVRAYDVDQERDIHFLVMEYVAGQSLQQLVARQGPVDFVAAAEYIRQASEGLHHAHRMGMVHRDIKPGNLLLDEKGTVKLLDLGLARFFHEKEEHSLTVKHDEKVLGTADYLSPEQALNSHTVDLRSDMYSMGCTLYFLLTGHPPFPDGTLAQRLLSHQTKAPPPVSAERKDVPPALQSILEKMMAKSPDERFQSAKETATALFDWLSAEGGPAWAALNPQMAGTGALGSGPATSSVLPSIPLDVSAESEATRIASALSTAIGAGDRDAGRDFAVNHPGDLPSVLPGAQVVDATVADPELAAMFAEMTGDGSTKLARSPLAVRPPETADPAPSEVESPELAQTVTAPEGLGPDLRPTGEDPAQAVTQTFVSPQEAPELPPEFQATVLGVSEMSPEVFAPTEPPLEDPFQALAAVASAPRVPDSPAPVARAIPVAQPVESPEVPVSRRNRTPGASGRLPMVAGGIALALAVLGVTAYLTLFRGSGDPDSKSGDKRNPKVEKVPKPEVPKDPTHKVAELRGEFTVGPAGQFKSIRDVLAELKTLKPNKSRNAVQIVKVAAGQTFAERIVIDDSYPPGIQFVAEPGAPPVLAPPGDEPVVKVGTGRGKVVNFRLEGFRIEASGKPVAIELTEWVSGTQLRRIELLGFGKTGIFLNGVQTYGKEEDRIVVEAATFQGMPAEAVGIRLARQTEDSVFVRLSQCRFFGPLDCGVVLEASARGIEISESIFAETVTGIRFQGEDRAWNDVAVIANTFYQTDRAIVFTHMPAARSRDLQFHNNLFVNSRTADAVVETGYKAADFFTMYRSFPGGAGHNWTTRSVSNPPPANELNTLFESTNSRRGVTDLVFLSTDRTSPDFLAPGLKAPQSQSGTQADPKRFGTQIGAVRPR